MKEKEEVESKLIAVVVEVYCHIGAGFQRSARHLRDNV